MHHWRPDFWGCRFGFFPFGFHFHGPRPLRRRKDYLEMLQHYKEELEAELREVEEEIEELKSKG